MSIAFGLPVPPLDPPPPGSDDLSAKPPATAGSTRGLVSRARFTIAVVVIAVVLGLILLLVAGFRP
ncbi:MAG TPA: hypothetical protein VFP19_06705 [Candidatus Limnocylindrales bacterium]|nr:hypothetical protein [Candidatus Limnocylindrales bacterium]